MRMLIRNVTGFYYCLSIIFNNGSVEKLDNLFDYYVDTDDNVLYVAGLNEDGSIWEDTYNIDNINEVKVYSTKHWRENNERIKN